MRITDLLKKSGIALGVKVADKSEAIDKLVSLHEKCGNLKDVKAYKEGILNREELGTTAVGMEVAIPHAKSEQHISINVLMHLLHLFSLVSLFIIINLRI